VVAKLLAEGLIEEIQSRGSLPVWRRDGDVARTLRIAGLTRAAAARPIGDIIQGPQRSPSSLPPQPGKVPAPLAPRRRHRAARALTSQENRSQN
jgi:hypothetical protein